MPERYVCVISHPGCDGHNPRLQVTLQAGDRAAGARRSRSGSGGGTQVLDAARAAQPMRRHEADADVPSGRPVIISPTPLGWGLCRASQDGVGNGPSMGRG
jgi:hypothetical protein